MYCVLSIFFLNNVFLFSRQFLMSTSSLANCFEPGGRSLLDSGVTHPSPQPLRCPVYESRLLGSPGQEIPTPAIGLGVYGAGYGKSQGYYGTCGGDATALYARVGRLFFYIDFFFFFFSFFSPNWSCQRK